VPFLDLGLQHRAIAADVDTAFARILDRCSFVGGSDVGEFEIAFGAYCGAEHAVGVANGTDAIVMALRALGIGPGDRVAVPANTFIATAEAVALVGGRVVVVDCDPIHQLIDPDSVANAMRSGRLSAVIAVDLYGQRAPIDQLVPLVRNHGAFLIEDAAQAQGATRFGAGIGSGVDVATTSFYPGKNLGAYGDGGAVITDSPALAHHVRLIANHGSRVRYQHEVVGTNSRLDTMQAAVLNAKLAHLDGWNEQPMKRPAHHPRPLDEPDQPAAVARRPHLPAGRERRPGPGRRARVARASARASGSRSCRRTRRACSACSTA
jgi:dTDP-4-amino-4,6-dideoxygalactose transaminase